MSILYKFPKSNECGSEKQKSIPYVKFYGVQDYKYQPFCHKTFVPGLKKEQMKEHFDYYRDDDVQYKPSQVMYSASGELLHASLR